MSLVGVMFGACGLFVLFARHIIVYEDNGLIEVQAECLINK